MYLVEFNNDKVHFTIGDGLRIPEGHLFKGGQAKKSEVLKYKIEGGDWYSYKGFLRQFLVPGSVIIILDDYDG